jgi:hypothetical protein
MIKFSKTLWSLWSIGIDHNLQNLSNYWEYSQFVNCPGSSPTNANLGDGIGSLTKSEIIESLHDDITIPDSKSRYRPKDAEPISLPINTRPQQNFSFYK